MNVFCSSQNYQVRTSINRMERMSKDEFLEIDIERCVRDSIDIFATTPRSCTYREHASDISIHQMNNDLVRNKETIFWSI